MFFRSILFLMLFGPKTIYSQTFIKDLLPREYVIDGSVDYTDYIQQALNSYDYLVFPSFPLMINEKGLILKSNTKIEFENGGKLTLKPNSESHYAMLMLENVENVELYNVVLEGDRNNHLSDIGEWGMGIYIKGGKNIIIKDGAVSDCWGDGIDIVYSKLRNSENIRVYDLKLFGNRRNGVTIGSGRNIGLYNLTISNSNGTLPKAGICIEPNNNREILEFIDIKNINSYNNGIGLSIGLMKYPSFKKRSLSIQISDFISTNDGIGILYGDYKRKYEEGFKKLEGYIKFDNIEIKNVLDESIKFYSFFGYEFSPKVIFKNIKIRSKKTFNDKNSKTQFTKNKVKNIFFENFTVEKL